MNDHYQKQHKFKNWFTKSFGTKEFIKIAAKLFFPAIIEIVILSSVTYLDSLFLALFTPNNMGAATKTATVLASQLLFLPIIIFIGTSAAAGILGSQYYGKKDFESFKETINISLLIGTLSNFLFVSIYAAIPLQMIELLSGDEISTISDPILKQNFLDTNQLAADYLRVQCFAIIPHLGSYVLANAYRQHQHTVIPLISSILAVVINIILNPILIIFAASDPTQAIVNVAAATVAARSVDILFLLIVTLTRKTMPYYFYNHLKIKPILFWLILKHGWQVILNELIFSIGTIVILMFFNRYNQYHRDAIATVNLIIQFTNLIWPGSATLVAVLVIAKLGNSEYDLAKENTRKLINWGIILGIILALIVVICSFFLNAILNPPTSNDIAAINKAKEIATTSMYLEWILAISVFMRGPYSIIYFCLRGGGSKFLFIIDSVATMLWLVIIGLTTNINVPQDYASRIDIVLIYFILELQSTFKLLAGLIIFKKTKWANNLVANHNFNENQNNNEVVVSN